MEKGARVALAGWTHGRLGEVKAEYEANRVATADTLNERDAEHGERLRQVAERQGQLAERQDLADVARAAQQGEIDVLGERQDIAEERIAGMEEHGLAGSERIDVLEAEGRTMDTRMASTEANVAIAANTAAAATAASATEKAERKAAVKETRIVAEVASAKVGAASPPNTCPLTPAP